MNRPFVDIAGHSYTLKDLHRKESGGINKKLISREEIVAVIMAQSSKVVVFRVNICRSGHISVKVSFVGLFMQHHRSEIGVSVGIIILVGGVVVSQ